MIAHYGVAGLGYTGRRVFAALPSAQRFALGRSVEGYSASSVIRMDLDRAESLGHLPGQLARRAPYRLLYTVPPPSEGEADARMQRFLAALDPPPERLVYLSTSGVYGDRDGQSTDETTPVNPRTARAKRRVAAETLLKKWCERKGVDCLLLRVPGIYGPGRLGLDRLRHGASVLRSEDSGPGNRIHVDDLARCCLAALTGSAPAGSYNVGDGDHRSSGEFTTTVARLARLPAPSEISLDEARRQWSPARLSFLGESRCLDLGRMRTVLGVSPTYSDAESGIRASLDEEAAAGGNPER